MEPCDCTIQETDTNLSLLPVEVSIMEPCDCTEWLCFFQHVLADIWVARMSDLGVNDQQYFCRTHIGHLLNVGDTVLG